MPSASRFFTCAAITAILADDTRFPGRGQAFGGVKGGVALALSPNDFAPRTQVGTVNSNPIIEASGLTASQHNAGVLWTHNDKSHPNHIYAIKANGGDLLGIFVLDGAVASDCELLADLCINGALDFEDIAVGPGPEDGVSYLYVGDIGSAKTERNTIDVHRVSEPEVNADGGGGQFATLSDVETFTFQYPGGVFYDSETLMVDPWYGDVYIVTKERKEENKVFRALARDLLVGSIIELEFMGTMDWTLAVGGDVLFNGREVIMKNKKKVRIYSREEDTELWEAIVKRDGVSLPYIEEPQGEAIAFASDGSGYYTLSEAKKTQTPEVPLYFYKRNGPLPVMEGTQPTLLAPTTSSLPTTESPQTSSVAPTAPSVPTTKKPQTTSVAPTAPSTALCENQKTITSCQNLITDTGCRWVTKSSRCSKAKKCGHIRESKQACLAATAYDCTYSYKNAVFQICTESSKRCTVARNKVACEYNSGCRWDEAAASCS